MRKTSSRLALILLAVAGMSQVGCRMCQSGFDYASPVAGASCGGCNTCRSGTRLSTDASYVESVASESTSDAPLVR